MNFIKKHWKIFLIFIIIFRFFLSYKLPSFYIDNLRYDDKLMINQLSTLVNGNYFGDYNDFTLIKGVIFPLFLLLANVLKVRYSVLLTIFYIISCSFFVSSLKNLISSKKFLIIVYVVLLFNPISYSSDLFQRLYRNSLSIIELYFFLGLLLRIILNEKDRVMNYVFLGFIVSVMYLTREDTIWTSVILIFLFFYNIYRRKDFRIVIFSLLPFIILKINLNIVSFINYKYYNVYTYNELKSSSFKDAYRNILLIKDDEHIDKVSIPKSTFYKLVDNCDTFNFSRAEIDRLYRNLSDSSGEIYNGNIIWYFRRLVYKNNEFKDGHEANEYFKKLSTELDNLFEEGVFEKEFVFPSIFINMPTKNEIKQIPIDLFKTIIYTSSYKNVKTVYNFKDRKYDTTYHAYSIIFHDYHNVENIIDSNLIGFEMIRLMYQYLTLIFMPISLIIFLRYIKEKDKLNLINFVVLILYLIIILGVSYTNTTGFPAIRYLYLGNIYILQSLFILLNVYRVYQDKVLFCFPSIAHIFNFSRKK